MLAPVSPWAAVSLALGQGVPRKLEPSPLSVAWDVANGPANGTLATSTGQAMHLFVRLASRPVDIVEQGGGVLTQKASALTYGLLQAVRGSAQELLQGDPEGAWTATLAAVAEAQAASRTLDAAMSTEAAKSLAILLSVAGVFAFWGLEFYLGKSGAEAKEQPDGEHASAPFLYGLGFAKYLMSWHVVFHNFYSLSSRGGGVVALNIFSEWGAMAAPWFLVVSGFLHSYAKMVGPQPNVQEDPFGAMVRRVGSWYPLYFLVVLWCALRSFSTDAEDWAHVVGDLLLVQGLVWEESGFPFVVGGWWLSFLMVYLVMWSPLHQVISNSSNSVLWTIFTIAYGLMFPVAIFEWMFAMHSGFWVCVTYWPSFVFGQGLAVWFVRQCMEETRSRSEPGFAMRPAHEIPLAGRLGATLSLLILCVLFFSFSPYDNVPLTSWPLMPLLMHGGLLPLLGMMVVGLAAGVDPIAKLFARAPLRWTEKIAFATFILQVPVHNTVRDLTGWGGLTWTFSASLLAASVLCHALVERPWRQVWGVRAK